MKLQYLTPTLHHIYMAIVCSVNCFILLLSLYFQIRKIELVFYGIVLLVLIFCIGILRVQTETLKDRPYSDRFITIFDYIGCFSLSLIAIYYLARIECFIGIVILSILIPIELAIIPIISYRYKIRNKIIKHLKMRKKKS